jgi:predicted RNA-binding Zn ribbon-like protein
MSEMSAKLKDLKIVGGELCLDFANTVAWRRDGDFGNHLHDYADLIAWGVHVKALDGLQADTLRNRAAAHPKLAQAAYNRAIALREAIYRIFSTVSAGGAIQASDVARLNATLAAGLKQLRIMNRGEIFVLDWCAVESELDLPSWMAVRSAADLLGSERLPRVHECQGQDCGWLFLDRSRNNSRRWCDMADCGNREKARRHYARKRNAVNKGT